MISESDVAELVGSCSGAHCLVLTGSRHQLMRQAFVRLAKDAGRTFLVFNPSYTVETYSREEFGTLVGSMDVAILNKQEAQYVCDTFGFADPAALSCRMRGALVVTSGKAGATAWQCGNATDVPSLSTSESNVDGAGDAFLAGFVHQLLLGDTTKLAGVFGAALASFVVESGDCRPAVTRAEVWERLQKRNPVAATVPSPG